VGLIKDEKKKKKERRRLLPPVMVAFIYPPPPATEAPIKAKPRKKANLFLRVDRHWLPRQPSLTFVWSRKPPPQPVGNTAQPLKAAESAALVVVHLPLRRQRVVLFIFFFFFLGLSSFTAYLGVGEKGGRNGSARRVDTNTKSSLVAFRRHSLKCNGRRFNYKITLITSSSHLLSRAGLHHHAECVCVCVCVRVPYAYVGHQLAACALFFAALAGKSTLADDIAGVTEGGGVAIFILSIFILSPIARTQFALKIKRTHFPSF
jgi:hypothetical protein